MTDMATRWRRSAAGPMVTVAELLDRAAVPRGSARTPAAGEPRPVVSVDALLRREGRATPVQGRPAHPHGRRSAIPDGAAPGRTRRTAVAASTLLAAGSVIGVAISNNTAEYPALGNTAQPVDPPPVVQSPPAPAGGLDLGSGEQAPVPGAAASSDALAAGSGPSADWTAVAFPPTAASSAGELSAGSTETADTADTAADTTAESATASRDDASTTDAEPRDSESRESRESEPRKDADTSGSDDDGDGGTPSSGAGSRGSGSTTAGSTPQDDDVVLAQGGSVEPAPATAEALIPDSATADGAAPADDPDDQDTPPAVDDSTDKAQDAVDGDSTGTETGTESGTDDATDDSDAESGSSSPDDPDEAAAASDGDDGSAGESAA